MLVLHSDIIPGDLASNIWRNNACEISYMRKKEKWILLKGEGMVTEWSLNGHWNVPAIQSTEWWLKGYWMAPFNFNGMVAFRLECRDRNLNTQPSTCKTNVLTKWDTAMANKEDIKSNNAFSRYGYVLPQEPLSSQLIFMCNLGRIELTALAGWTRIRIGSDKSMWFLRLFYKRKWWECVYYSKKTIH